MWSRRAEAGEVTDQIGLPGHTNKDGEVMHECSDLKLAAWFAWRVVRNLARCAMGDVARHMGFPIWVHPDDGDPLRSATVQQLEMYVFVVCKHLNMRWHERDGLWCGIRMIVRRLHEVRAAERDFRRLQRIVHEKTGLYLANPRQAVAYLQFLKATAL